MKTVPKLPPAWTRDGKLLQDDDMREALSKNTACFNTRLAQDLERNKRVALFDAFPDHFLPDAWHNLHAPSYTRGAEVYGIWQGSVGDPKRAARGVVVIRANSATIMVDEMDCAITARFTNFVYSSVGQRVAPVHARVARLLADALLAHKHGAKWLGKSQVWAMELVDIMDVWASVNATGHVSPRDAANVSAQWPRQFTVWH